MAHDVFISYASEDRKIAFQICSALEDDGIRCWIAPRNIPVGVFYSEAITEAIDRAQIVLLILTPDSNDSRHVVSELDQATEKELCIVPLQVKEVKLSGKISYYIGAFQRLDVTAMAPDEYLPRLRETIRELLGTCKPGEEGVVDPPIPSEPPSQTSLHSFKNSLGNTLVQLPAERLASGQESGTPFYVCTTCVSNRDYYEFVRAGGPPPVAHRAHPQLRTWQGGDYPDSMGDHPVVFVPHKAATRFCQWLTEKDRQEGLIRKEQEYRLPTLAQWKAFAGGEDLSDNAVCGRQWEPLRQQPTEPVSSGAASDLGLHHLFGNVFEWCVDKDVQEWQRGGHPYTTTCRLAVGGGWASSRDWLRQEWQQKTYGAIWCPGGWPMKDGGFRICLTRTQGWIKRWKEYFS
jgi:hypothetical protein